MYEKGANVAFCSEICMLGGRDQSERSGVGRFDFNVSYTIVR